jgi:hypothetical protein
MHRWQRHTKTALLIMQTFSPAQYGSRHDRAAREDMLPSLSSLKHSITQRPLTIIAGVRNESRHDGDSLRERGIKKFPQLRNNNGSEHITEGSEENNHGSLNNFKFD